MTIAFDTCTQCKQPITSEQDYIIDGPAMLRHKDCLKPEATPKDGPVMRLAPTKESY